MVTKSPAQTTKTASVQPQRQVTPAAAPPQLGAFDAQQAMHDPLSLSPQAMLRLQRSIGNRALANLVQRKTDEAAQVRAMDTRSDQQVSAEADAVITPDYQNAALRDRRPTKYVFTIAVARSNPRLLEFVKLRAKSVFRNKMRHAFRWMPGVRKARDAQQTKMSTAMRMAKSGPGGANMSPAQLHDEARSIAAQSGNVGHTWVKLKTLVGDQIQKLYTFGLHPIRPGRPNQTVPGRIQHPDSGSEGAPTKRFIDFRITSTDFESALAYVKRLISSRISYNLLKQNCTTFARDVATHLGISFPGGATVIPYGPLQIFSDTMYNPNQLYEDMAGEEGAHDTQAAPPPETPGLGAAAPSGSART